MSRIKDYYFNEINQINEVNMVDAEYLYQNWLKEIVEEKFVEDNEERFESEKIFSMTNTYPF